MRNTSLDHRQLRTERQAAAWLDISQRTLWQRRHDGLIPFIRDGRLIKYDVDDLSRYIDARRQSNEKGSNHHE